MARRQKPRRRREALFHQGAAFEGVYLVVSGCLTLRQALADGTERIVGFALPGDIVGFEGWRSGRYAFTAEALQLTSTCRISSLQPGASTDNAIALSHLLFKATDQLSRVGERWAGHDATSKVSAFLDDFLLRARQRGLEVSPDKLPMTRAEIGSYLGLAEETVVRALQQLRANGAAARFHRQLCAARR